MRADENTVVAEAARAVQIWAYPLVFAQRVRLNFTQPLAPAAIRPPTSAGAPVNTIGHQRRLSDPTLTVGVAPNVDTLYSVAWIDVRHHDATLRFPDFGHRYASFQLALPDTSTPITLSAAASDGRLPVVSLTRGPDVLDTGDDEIRLQTSWRYVMIVGRLLVDPAAPDDLPVAHELQDAIELRCRSIGRPQHSSTDEELARRGRTDETTDPEVFALALRQVLDDAHPGVLDGRLRQNIERAHLLDDPVPPAALPALAEGLRDGLQDIQDHVRAFGRLANGWAINDIGTDFGEDHLLRAAVAHSQIFVNPASEALYPVCEVDSAGEPLDGGAHRYRLTFEAGTFPPVHAFWSLTVYHAHGLLVANEIDRYAIGNRTPGLHVDASGALTIEIQATRPASTANWLPAPAGRFRLMLRLYRPTDPRWVPPPVVAVAPRP